MDPISQRQVMDAMCIEYLRRQLSFTQQALEEKEQQLQYYKQLVDTLSSLLQSSKAETRPHSEFERFSPPTDQEHQILLDKVSTPNRPFTKIKKTVSWHEDVEVRYITPKVAASSTIHPYCS